MMEVTGSTVDEGPQRKVPARSMHQLKEPTDVTVPITDTDTLVEAASQAVRVPNASFVFDGARVELMLWDGSQRSVGWWGNRRVIGNMRVAPQQLASLLPEWPALSQIVPRAVSPLAMRGWAVGQPA
jgi:hypothetical protein